MRYNPKILPKTVMLKKEFIVALLIVIAQIAMAQEPITIALYDAENLYDTINVTRNRQFTKSSSADNMWNVERYKTKIQNTAKVIDSLNAPIIAVIGIENEAVARDLVIASQGEYCYTYRTLNYFDDLDCALLYYGDYLMVEKVETSNYVFTVKGLIDTLPIEINITRRGNKLRNFESQTPDGIRIVMGALSHRDLNRLQLEDPLQPLAKQGVGDTYGNMGWYLQNRVGVSASTNAQYSVESGIYYAKWLIANDLGRPLPTYLFGHYVGGYSNHLPIVTRIKVEAK